MQLASCYATRVLTQSHFRLTRPHSVALFTDKATSPRHCLLILTIIEGPMMLQAVSVSARPKVAVIIPLLTSPTT
jgi:hypothetical protein